MASFIPSLLRPGETVLYTSGITRLSLLPYVLLGLFTLRVYGFGLLLILFALASWRATEFAITDRRLIAKYGLIARYTTEIPLSAIETVQIKQSVLARLLRFGDLIVAGAGNPQVVLTGIAKPVAFRNRLLDACSLQRAATMPPLLGTPSTPA